MNDNVVDLSERRRRKKIESFRQSLAEGLTGVSFDAWMGRNLSTQLQSAHLAQSDTAPCTEFVHYFGDPPSRCHCGEREWGHCD